MYLRKKHPGIRKNTLFMSSIFGSIYRVSQEERSIFWEVIV
jgi:hypothetical protein